MAFTFNAYMLIYALVFGSTRAQNYCQWSGIAHTSKYGTLVKESVYYRTMYLFESSSCSGTSCVLNAVYPAVKKAADNVPSSNVKYICDNQPHPAGSNSPVIESQVAYICTCNGPYPASISVAVNSGPFPVSCATSELNYCGPFPARKQYCSQGGTYNGTPFSSCSVFEACDGRSVCVTNDTSTNNNLINCDNAMGSSGSYIQGAPGTGSSSVSTTNYCRACTSDPNMNEKCAAKYGNSGGVVVLPRSSSSSLAVQGPATTKLGTSSSQASPTIRAAPQSSRATSAVIVAPVAGVASSPVGIVSQPAVVATPAAQSTKSDNSQSQAALAPGSSVAIGASMTSPGTNITPAVATSVSTMATPTAFTQTTTAPLPVVTTTSGSGAEMTQVGPILGLVAIVVCVLA